MDCKSSSSEILKNLTSTEKLLIALAFDTYDNINEIQNNLKYNNINISNIENLHKILKKESLDEGYSSLVDYWQNKRLLLAINEYEKIKKIIYDILDNKIHYESINIPENKTMNIGQFMHFDFTNKSQHEINDFIVENLETIEINMGDQNAQIEPKNINNKIINKNFKIKAESPKNVKDKKRFYIRMDEDEKVVDDYFDYLDMKNSEGDRDIKNLGKFSGILKTYPLLVKGKEGLVVEKKDKVVEKKVEKKIEKKVEKKIENKVEKKDKVIEKKVEIEVLKTPFDILMHKIQTTKRQDKDKSMWKSELRTIVDHLAPIFGKEGKFDSIYEELEGNTLQYTIMNMMLIIQDYIIEEEEDTILDEYCEYKRKLAAFCDYYKK